MKKLILVTLILLSAAASVHADELDDALLLVKQYAAKTINDPDFVKACLGFPTVPGICNAANAPGGGLVCPPAPAPTTNSHTCELLSSLSADASFGTKLGQLLKLTADFTTHFLMVSEEKSIPTHYHRIDCSGSSCASEYITRQDGVMVLFVMAQKGKISLTPPTTLQGAISFDVGGEKAKSFKIGITHYCEKATHPQPLSCGRKEGPITPGGSTTGDGTSIPTEPEPFPGDGDGDGDACVVEPGTVEGHGGH